MTYGEIVNLISFKVWGNTIPTAQTLVRLRGDEGLIAQTCKRIQRDYNYWFMEQNVAIDVIANVQSYDLPDRYKSIIDVIWKGNNQNGYSRPLCTIHAEDAHANFWQSDNAINAEYPMFYQIRNNSIVLYPDPLPDPNDETATRELHIILWKYLPALPDDQATFDAYEDALSNYGVDVIVNRVASELCEIHDEWDKAQMYKLRADEALFELKKEDYRRRQSHLSNLYYGD